MFRPLVDVYELDDGTTVLEAEVPGARNETLDVTAEKGLLTISAEAQEPAGRDKYARSCTGFVRGRYQRQFALSDDVDQDGIDAKLADGVLTVRLPRTAAARVRKIPICGD